MVTGYRFDIDLFTDKPFNPPQIADHLKNTYHAESVKTLKNGVFCFIEDIKVDVMSHQYPWIKSPIVQEGIVMTSLEDIGAMKLHAIVQSGSRLKDFIDVYFLLERISLATMFECSEQKYPDASRSVAQKALLYRDDIKQSTIGLIGKELDLSTIADRLKYAVLYPAKVISKSTSIKELPTVRKRKRGRGI